jgi:hypothetical protein
MATRRRTQHVALLTLGSLLALLIVVVSGGPSRADVTQSVGCFSPVTGNWSSFSIPIAGTASPGTINPGETTTLSGTSVTVTVDSALIAAGVGAGVVSEGDNFVYSTINLRIVGAGATEDPQVASGQSKIVFNVSIDGTTGAVTVVPDPVVATVPLTDTIWTASGAGNVELSTDTGPLPANLSNPTIAERNNAPLRILNRLSGTDVEWPTDPPTNPPAGLNADFICWPGESNGDGTALVPGSAGVIATATVEGATEPTEPTTTTTTQPTTTTTQPTTTTTTAPEPEAPNVGTAVYVTECTNTITPDISELTFEVTGEAPFRVNVGEPIVLTNNRWTVTVPASVLNTGIGLGLLAPGDTISGAVRGGVAGTNTLEGVVEFGPVPISVGPIEVDPDFGEALPAEVTFDPGDLVFTASGGQADFSLAFASVDVAIGPIELTFECTPTVLGLVFVSTEVIGDPLQPPATPATAEQAGATTGTLPATGASGLLLQLLIAAILIDVGYLGWSAARPATGRRGR